MSDDDKVTALEKIATKVRACRKCRLYKKATHGVPGEGNPDAKVLFIGEGPGKTEDAQGRPFVGAAGKILTAMIESIGWQREDVFIANVVKHRPPENRDPKPDEVETCWPFLEAQIKIIRPRIIVLLGRHSLGRFFPGMKISACHGKLIHHQNDKQAFLPLYHPAVTLYSPSQKTVLQKDFARIPKILAKLERIKNKE